MNDVVASIPSGDRDIRVRPQKQRGRTLTDWRFMTSGSGNFIFTSESVTPGHPDKLSDVIAEHIVAAILEQDPEARTAVEGLLGKGFFQVAGEVTTEAWVNVEKIVREVALKIGYNNSSIGLDGNAMAVLSSISEQSPEIAGGVFNSLESRLGVATDDFDKLGAGDQGLVFGTAVAHNKSYHPVSHKLAVMLSERLWELRNDDQDAVKLYPDAKTQVSIRFENNHPVEIETVLISTSHAPAHSLSEVQAYVIENVIKPVIQAYNENEAAEGFQLTDSGNYIVNPAGEWNVCGPASDVGLVGRKIVVDTTGGWGRHGGGNLNGKDRTKVDRIGVYAARHAAKNLVAAGLADNVEIQISYAIGQARPVSVYVNTFGTNHYPQEFIDAVVEMVFDFRPAAIIARLDPTPSALRETAMFGHLGRNPRGLFKWEALDKAEEIEKLAFEYNANRPAIVSLWEKLTRGK